MSSTEQYTKEEKITTNENRESEVQTNISTARTFNQKLKITLPNEVLFSPSGTKLDKDVLYDAFLFFQNCIQIRQRNEEIDEPQKNEENNDDKYFSPKKTEESVKLTNKDNFVINKTKIKNYDDIPAIGHNENFVDLVEKTLANEPSADPNNYHSNLKKSAKMLNSTNNKKQNLKGNLIHDTLPIKKLEKKYTYYSTELYPKTRNLNKKNLIDNLNKKETQSNNKKTKRNKTTSKGKVKANNNSSSKPYDKGTNINNLDKQQILNNYKNLSKQLHKSNTNDPKFFSKTFRYTSTGNSGISKEMLLKTGPSVSTKKKFLTKLNYVSGLNEDPKTDEEEDERQHNFATCQSEKMNVDEVQEFKLPKEKTEEEPKVSPNVKVSKFIIDESDNIKEDKEETNQNEENNEGEQNEDNNIEFRNRHSISSVQYEHTSEDEGENEEEENDNIKEEDEKENEENSEVENNDDNNEERKMSLKDIKNEKNNIMENNSNDNINNNVNNNSLDSNQTSKKILENLQNLKTDENNDNEEQLSIQSNNMNNSSKQKTLNLNTSNIKGNPPINNPTNSSDGKNKSKSNKNSNKKNNSLTPNNQQAIVVKKKSSAELEEEILNLNLKTGEEKKKILLDKENQLDSLKRDYERLNKQLLDGINQFNQAKEYFLLWKKNEIKKLNDQKKEIEDSKRKLDKRLTTYDQLVRTNKIQEDKINSLNRQNLALKREFSNKEHFYKKTIEELKELLNDYSEKTEDNNVKGTQNQNQSQCQIQKQNTNKPSFIQKKKKEQTKLTKSNTTNRINVVVGKDNNAAIKTAISVIRNPIYSSNTNNKITKPITERKITALNNNPAVNSCNNQIKNKIKISNSSKSKQDQSNPNTPKNMRLKIENKNEFDLENVNRKHDSECIQKEAFQDGKIIKIFSDGHKEIAFASGVNKEIYPDGYQIVYFQNGDIKQILSDGRIKYYFKDQNTTQTTYKDGLLVYKFPNQQIEKHFPDGRKEIYCENGTVKVINPNGKEEIFEPNQESIEQYDMALNEDEPVQESISESLSFYKITETSNIKK